MCGAPIVRVIMLRIRITGKADGAKARAY
jgi:hypothetical protein